MKVSENNLGLCSLVIITLVYTWILSFLHQKDYLVDYIGSVLAFMQPMTLNMAISEFPCNRSTEDPAAHFESTTDRFVAAKACHLEIHMTALP